MFNDKNKIKDDRDYFSKGSSSLTPVYAILGGLFVASVMMKDANLYDFKNYIKDIIGGESNEDIELFVPQTKNEMFCPIPGQKAEPLKNYFDDPFQGVLISNHNDFSFFWVPSKAPKTLSFEFSKEATKTRDKEQWYESIPQHVIDDPEINFILSGHASYDLDEKYPIGLGATKFPENFEAIQDRHREVNQRYVEKRLEHVKSKLIDLGIAEDRIITRNYGHRFDRRAVDVEICFPDQNSPEPES